MFPSRLVAVTLKPARPQLTRGPPHTKFGGPSEWREWIAQLERFRALGATTIVAGHGGLVGQEAIDKNVRYLTELLAKPQ